MAHARVTVAYLPFTLAILPSILICVLGFHPLNIAIAAKPLLFLGRVSYSIYMVHAVIQMAIMGGFRAFDTTIPTGSLLFVALCTTTVMIIATASYHLIEIPAQAALRKPRGRTAEIIAPIRKEAQAD